MESRARDRQPIRSVLDVTDDTACKGASFGAPWPPEEDKGQEEVLSLWICLSIYLSNQQQTVGPFRE